MKKILQIVLLGISICLFGACSEDNAVRERDKMPVLTPEVQEMTGAVTLTKAQMEYNHQANDFALRLLEKLYKGESLIASPLSLQMALSMAVNGTDGQTKQEILKVLGFEDMGLDALNEYSKTLIEQLPAVDGEVGLQLADAMIVRDDAPLKASYKETIRTFYYAPVQPISFKDEEYVKSVVNDWCNRNTNGLIPDILDKVDPAAEAYLLNALYFKAMWFNKFDPDHQVLKNSVFRSNDGECQVDYLTDKLSASYADEGSFRTLRLSFGKTAQFGFIILLPKEDDGLSAMLDHLAGTSWQSVLDAEEWTTDILLRFPRFETASRYNLKSILMSMGMEKAFTAGADFGNMFDSGTHFIHDVIQKARIALDEEGVEAAAVTMLDMCGSEAGLHEEKEPIVFYADHPFAYMITERSSGTILFAGTFTGK